MYIDDNLRELYKTINNVCLRKLIKHNNPNAFDSTAAMIYLLRVDKLNEKKKNKKPKAPKNNK